MHEMLMVLLIGMGGIAPAPIKNVTVEILIVKDTPAIRSATKTQQTSWEANDYSDFPWIKPGCVLMVKPEGHNWGSMERTYGTILSVTNFKSIKAARDALMPRTKPDPLDLTGETSMGTEYVRLATQLINIVKNSTIGAMEKVGFATATQEFTFQGTKSPVTLDLKEK